MAIYRMFDNVVECFLISPQTLDSVSPGRRLLRD